METINKKCKNIIDNLTSWDYISILDKNITDIDWDLFEIDNQVWKDYWELFEMLVEYYIDEEKEKWIQESKA